ncbi:SPL family radical SAM protein [Sinanaerobacter sp. ZZT-01]|uniref:SPL family radical SAM protein n=1 Tax=Sinanaerobacter sp. ZZT-01 TaxID=3111540 RepID=UPI002D794AF3|nr:radical SAM protein [Sinanaerobacter sp. ZZT-01]WRR94493.1 radical SAM protein [Sinanaerobacter sp. ZZT-01]
MHDIEAKSILSPKNGMNLYRGCTHGCIYCDSRSNCYGMTFTFEDVAVKRNAPQLLEAALRKKKVPCMIGTGSMSDPYMPLEKTECMTRTCLELIDRYGFGFSTITKSDLILRDIDLLQSVNQKAKCVVQMTLTTYDDDLCRILEPNVAVTSRRFEVLKELQKAGIPTVVWMTPILPFINDTDENIRGLLNYCSDAGVKGIISFGIGMTLRSGNREYFYKKLDAHFPGMKRQYMHSFGSSYGIKSPNSKVLGKLVTDFCKAHGILTDTKEVFDYASQLELPQTQLSLF